MYERVQISLVIKVYQRVAREVCHISLLKDLKVNKDFMAVKKSRKLPGFEILKTVHQPFKCR